MLKPSLIRILPLLATAILCAVGISLGNWQTRRAEEKETIAALMQEKSRQAPVVLSSAQKFSQLQSFQKVKLVGTFEQNWPLYLDNRPLKGVAGFYVLMPFKLQDSEKYVLVARGWLQRNPAERTKIPSLLTAQGVVEVEGVVREQLDRTMQLGKSESLKPGSIVQSVSFDELRQHTGLAIMDKVLEQTSSAGDGLIRDWPKPSDGSDKHRAYAFQWYGLALMAAIFFVVTGIRRGKIRK
ncbi:SURF1 family protein [Undibacterium seohonense]|jgi:surfeit locus 1 family protein|uniref:SURF1-like protein n=1 Tax=Undibacterium seohonense TaxID=1344950 RepID=A0ABR6X2P5_9BURK|nr:SURF1 family protein [Undibacterium seohonense]MBC3807126.1 SURF1 family protein [Undibacterium seohonense]